MNTNKLTSIEQQHMTELLQLRGLDHILSVPEEYNDEVHVMDTAPIESIIAQEQLIEHLFEEIHNLSPVHQLVLKGYFGLNDVTQKTQTELAELTNHKSRDTVRSILGEALLAMRAALVNRGYTTSII